MGVLLLADDPHGAEQYVDIEPQGPLLDVAMVKLDALFHLV